MHRLNRWQRLGIVASILWVMGAGFYSLENSAEQAVAFAQAVSNSCHETNDPNVDCAAEFDDAFHSNDSNTWPLAAMVAFLPIPFAWLFAYVAIWTTRWIRAGR